MSLLKKLLKPIYETLSSSRLTTIRNYKILTELMHQERIKKLNNNFAKKYAKQFFSQTDEDGITLEILKRIGKINNKTFLELGVGDGLENNTLVLLSLGWKGTWYGGEELAFNYTKTNKLRHQKVWIDKENIRELYQKSLVQHNINQHDVISIDLDGNDIYIAEELLKEGASPELFICEYNGIFPTDSRWKIRYNPSHVWTGDHYFGASLRSFVDLFEARNYFLCACNPQTGTNAFFVKSEYRELFKDVPKSIEDIFVEPCFWIDNKFKHRISPEFIKSIVDYE